MNCAVLFGALTDAVLCAAVSTPDSGAEGEGLIMPSVGSIPVTTEGMRGAAGDGADMGAYRDAFVGGGGGQAHVAKPQLPSSGTWSPFGMAAPHQPVAGYSSPGSVERTALGLPLGLTQSMGVAVDDDDYYGATGAHAASVIHAAAAAVRRPPLAHATSVDSTPTSSPVVGAMSPSHFDSADEASLLDLPRPSGLDKPSVRPLRAPIAPAPVAAAPSFISAAPFAAAPSSTARATSSAAAAPASASASASATAATATAAPATAAPATDSPAPSGGSATQEASASVYVPRWKRNRTQGQRSLAQLEAELTAMQAGAVDESSDAPGAGAEADALHTAGRAVAETVDSSARGAAAEVELVGVHAEQVRLAWRCRACMRRQAQALTHCCVQGSRDSMEDRHRIWLDLNATLGLAAGQNVPVRRPRAVRRTPLTSVDELRESDRDSPISRACWEAELSVDMLDDEEAVETQVQVEPQALFVVCDGHCGTRVRITPHACRVAWSDHVTWGCTGCRVCVQQPAPVRLFRSCILGGSCAGDAQGFCSRGPRVPEGCSGHSA